MSGIIGRLFREFAVTLTMTIVVSAIVSLTLTPMMASRFLQGSHATTSTAGSTSLSERGFAALAKGYERGLDFVLRHRFATLMVFLATVAATGLSLRHHPQGLLPAAGHRHHVRQFRRGAGHLVRRDDRSGRRSSARSSRPIRTSRTVAMALGAGVGSSAQNNGRMFITLKPRDERDADAFQIIARLRPKLAKVEGRAALPAGGAGRHRRRARRAHAVPIHAAGRQSRRTERLGAEDSGQAAAACRNCATSPPTSRSPARR